MTLTDERNRGNVAIRGSAKGNDGSTAAMSTCPFVIPTGTVAKDVIYVVLTAATSATATITPPDASWTNPGTQTNVATTQTYAMYKRIVTAADGTYAGTTQTFGVSGKNSGFMVVVSDSSGTDEITTTSGTASSTSIVDAADTGVRVGGLVLVMAALRTGSATTNALSLSGWTSIGVSNTTASPSSNNATAIYRTAKTANKETVAATTFTASSAVTGRGLYTIIIEPS